MVAIVRTESDYSPRVACRPCQAPSDGDDPVVAQAFMQCAAASAKAGVKLGHGGPFGACVVKGGIVVSCAHNSVLLDKDPTCHAEMNAIRQACAALQSHDLSDCELYTSCEPCPMCWGSVQWSRLNKVYIGADRFTAAKYGFDDKVFYDEVETHAESFGLHRYGFIPDSNVKSGKSEDVRLHKNMMEFHVGTLSEEVEQLFTNSDVNKTFRRRLGSGTALRDMYRDAFKNRPLQNKSAPRDASNISLALEFGDGDAMPISVSADSSVVELTAEVRRALLDVGKNKSPKRCAVDAPPVPSLAEHAEVPLADREKFMREAIQAARTAAKQGASKEREPFAAVVVHDGKVIARASNSVLQTRDATATAEVNAIRAAAAALDSYDLSECMLYTTTVPDVMSMAACLWARIPHVFAGVSQEFALRHGHEEGWLHFQELMAGRPEDRAIQTVEDVAKPLCEDVFKFWSSLNGKIY